MCKKEWKTCNSSAFPCRLPIILEAMPQIGGVAAISVANRIGKAVLFR